MRGLNGWIEIFRGGQQTDSAGRTHDGDGLIDKAVANFNVKEHEPPVVIGHPADNAPAFGWVEGLRKTVKDGAAILEAKFKQVIPEFADIVEKGLFKKRSAAFYPDGSLRHVGFLGANPPAVKGLADIGFKAGDGAVTFEFSDDSTKSAQEARAKKYGIAVKDGGHVTKPGEWSDVPDSEFLDPVNYRYPIPDADQTRTAAAYWGKPKNQEQYSSEERVKITDRLNAARKKYGIGGSEHMEPKFTEADMEKIKADAAAKAEADTKAKMEAEFAERQAKGIRDAKVKDIKTQLDQMVRDGKIPPVIIDMGLADFMASLEPVAIFTFSDGKRTANQADFMFSMLDKMETLGIFKEIATKDRQGGQEFSDQDSEVKAGLAIAEKVNRKPKGGKC